MADQDTNLVEKPDFSAVPNMRQGPDGNAWPQDLKPGQQAGTPLAEVFFNPLLKCVYALISAVNQTGNNLKKYLPLTGGTLAGPLEVQTSDFSNQKLAVNTEMADSRYLKLTGGKLTGTIADNGQYSGGTAQSVVPNSAAFVALQLLGAQDQEVAGLVVYSPKTGKTRIFRFAPDGSVTDPDGNRLLTPDLGKSLFLSLSGGTVTGDIGLIGSGKYGNTALGGIAQSRIKGSSAAAYLQLQNTDGADRIHLVCSDGSGGFKNWVFDPATGQITDPNNQIAATQDWAKNSFLQLPSGSPPLKIQAFSVTGGANNGAPRITFPETFSKTLSVSAIVNQTPGSHNSRTVNILPSGQNINDMQVDNSGFTCQIFYTLGGGGAGTTGDPWTMLVTAIGVA